MTDENAIKDCIKKCWECRHQCQKDLYTYCLQEGGEHVAPDHVRLMTDCIQICQTAADFMTRGSELHTTVCMACMEVCQECAKSCADLDMKECADACRVCAIACQKMIDPGKQEAA